MDENKLCRACLAPQGTIKYSSLFTDNGKIAKEIYKLTNLVILDLTDINSSAAICQRCLMDLERAISFRELVIRSDDHFRESCNTAMNKILEKLVKEVKTVSNLESKDINPSKNSSITRSDNQLLLESSERNEESKNSTKNLHSLVKLEQFELECVKNENNEDKSTLDCKLDSNSSQNSLPKVTKIRQKTTKMRPNPANLREDHEELATNYSQNCKKLEFNQIVKNSEQKVKNSNNLYKSAQISEDFDNDSKSGDQSLNNEENNSELYHNFDNFYKNLKDITPNLISNYEHQNHIKMSKKRRIFPDYSSHELDSKEIKCHICSKIFTKRCYLTQHFQTIHMTFKPHRCKKCGKKYASLEELSQHEEKHVADKPFKCPCCPKAFIHKSDLKRHEISHSVRKPFQCRLCSRGFVRNDHLLKHEKVHQRKIEKGSKLKVRSVGIVNGEIFGV